MLLSSGVSPRSTAFLPRSGLVLLASLPLALLGTGGCRSADKPLPPPPGAPSAAQTPTPPPAPPATPPPAAEGAGTAGDAYFGVIEPHFERVTIYKGPKVFLEEYGKTPERARNLLTAHWAASEISNGGFLQLFSGAAGVLAPESVIGLRALGLGPSADIVEQAMALLGRTYPREMDKRHRLVEARKRQRKQANPFADLDERFFESLRRHPGGFNAVAADYAGKS